MHERVKPMAHDPLGPRVELLTQRSKSLHSMLNMEVTESSISDARKTTN